MRDFLIGAVYTLACCVLTLGMQAIWFWLPFVVFGVVVLVGYAFFIRGIWQAVQRGETPDVRSWFNV